MYGELGNGASASSLTPVKIASNLAFDALTLNDEVACAIQQGVAWCWGYNPSGQLGLGNVAQVRTPTAMAGQWKQISLDQSHSCGIARTGSLACWGENGRGELGVGSYQDSAAPLTVGSDTDWSSVATGAGHSCAIKNDRSLWCWGANDNGELGDGTAWFDRLTVVR
jgi:alpha-tubulin suppressor-like RCC1 family protein